MQVSVRELRNHTARVIALVESGEPVVLTVHGRPVADITPHSQRSQVRSSEVFLAELADLAAMASEARAAGAALDSADFETGLTTDDMLPGE